MVTLDEAGRAALWTTLHVPPAGLADIVEHAWTQIVPGHAGAGLRIVADASPHLLVQAGRDGSVRVRVVGARRRWVDAPIADRAWSVGVRLRPGVLPLLTRLPASEHTDRGEDAAVVLCGRGRRMVDEICAAPSPERALRSTLAFLAHVRRMRAPDVRAAGLARALGACDGGRVRELADRLGLADRTVRQVCADAIGLSPVRVARIGRLHRTLALRLRDPAPGWAAIAARGGYADQSHMIREFGALLGESPARFLMRRRTRVA